MKRGVVILLSVLACAVVVIAWRNHKPLSEAERLQRARDYALLVEALGAVGYEGNFPIGERYAFEENMRRLWSSKRTFADARKNVELLLAMGDFDFIAEGLRRFAPEDDPYYRDWPRDPSYVAASIAAAFSNEEALWLMLLLPDDGFPQAHAGFRDAFNGIGANVLKSSRKESMWFYYEMTAPGLLDDVHGSFYWGYKRPEQIEQAFRSADDQIRGRIMRAIDPDNFRNPVVRPTRAFAFDELEALLEKYPPTDPWDGGYIIAREPFANGPFELASTYQNKNSALEAVTNPANARFAIYEHYMDREYYSTYSRTDGVDDPIDVYLWHLDIRIVDLLTGKQIFGGYALANPPPETVSIMSLLRATKIKDGVYYHNDFDYEKYAAAMEAYIVREKLTNRA